jgi:hypothetical protein
MDVVAARSSSAVFAPHETGVEITSTEHRPATASAVRRVIVAVHGVGDQYSFATIQAVVNQFCRHYNHPAGVPLGSFHAETKKAAKRPFSLPLPWPREPFGRLAFAEVYWAKVPRSRSPSGGPIPSWNDCVSGGARRDNTVSAPMPTSR